MYGVQLQVKPIAPGSMASIKFRRVDSVLAPLSSLAMLKTGRMVWTARLRSPSCQLVPSIHHCTLLAKKMPYNWLSSFLLAGWIWRKRVVGKELVVVPRITRRCEKPYDRLLRPI
jgi:hypothetical protein